MEDICIVPGTDTRLDLKHIAVDGETFERWQEIGTAVGLGTDTQIANYLIRRYNSEQDRNQSSARCIICNTTITLICARCQSLQTHNEPFPGNTENVDTLISSHVSPATEYVKTKTESFDDSIQKHEEQQSGLCAFAEQLNSNTLTDTQLNQVTSAEVKTDTATNDLDKSNRRRQNKGRIKFSAPRERRKYREKNALDTSNTEDVDDGLPLTFRSDFTNSNGLENVNQEWKSLDAIDNSSVIGKIADANSQGDLAGQQFVCTLCPATFLLQRELKNHLRTHSGEKPYTCSNCSAVFKWKHTLRDHMLKIHSIHQSFPCKVCTKRFSSYSDLRQHQQTHKELRGNKSHKCTECDAAFANACHLKLHMRTHTGEKPFVCSMCSSCFATKDKLKVHMRRHTGERPYVCEECGYTFKESTVLKTHMRTHTGEKPYVCKECGVAFAQSSALRTHMRIHTGEKPHMCTVCGAAFPSSSRLDRHMRVHTGDRPYVCSECGSGFKSSGELTSHTRTHTKYKPAICKECGASFSQHGNLKIHMRTHTGEKPYICEVCSMAFRQQGGLKMHMLMHTGEKPCVCEICGATYRKAQTLRLHKQKKHPTQNQAGS